MFCMKLSMVAAINSGNRLLQICRLVRDIRIGRTMWFIKAIARKVYEQVKYFVRNGPFYTIINGTLNKGFALRL